MIRKGNAQRGKTYKKRKMAQRTKTVTNPLLRPPETKYVDGYLSSTAIHQLSITAADTWADTELNPVNASGAYGCLPMPRIGDDYADRDGRKIILKNIRIKGVLYWNGVEGAVDTTEMQPVRLIVVKDTKTNGATLNGEDVIGAGQGADGSAAGGAANNALYQFTKPTGWGRYKVVHDEFIEPPPLGFSGSGNSFNQEGYASVFNIKINCNCEVNFSGTTGAIASIVDNSYHVLIAAGFQDANIDAAYMARTSFVG